MDADRRQRWPLVVVPLLATPLWLATVGTIGDIGLALPAGVAFLGGAGYILWHAAIGKRWALLSVFAFSVIFPSISFRERGIGHVGLDWQNGAKVGIWIAMLAIVTARHAQVLRLIRDAALAPWLCFCLVAMLSAIYSPVPAISGIAAASILANVCFACVLAVDASPRQVLLVMAWSLAALCFINLLSAVFLPDIAFVQTGAVDIRFRGVSGHPNSLARQAVLTIGVAFAAIYRGYMGRRAFGLIASLGTIALVASEGRTAALSLALGLVALSRKYLLPVLIAVVFGLLLITLLGYSDALLALVGREGDTAEALSMAGRTELWHFVWEQIGQRPLVGHGFNTFESIASATWYGLPEASMETHNNYLDILYSCGLLGAIPAYLGIGVLLYRWRTDPDPSRDLLIWIVIISTFTEVVITAVAVMPSLSFFIVIALDAERRIEERPV